MPSETAVVGRFPYRHEAEIAAGYLNDAGIVAAVFADDGGGSEPALGWVRPARLTVRTDQEAEALELLRELGIIPDGSAGDNVGGDRVEAADTD